MTDPLTEAVARIIANAMGDNFADAFKNKARWIAKRGRSGGRFRDVNEPMQDDYLSAAQAAIAAMREHMLPRPDTPPVANAESTGVSDTTAQLAEAQREIDRLRAALADIVETPNAGWMIARAALEPKP